MYILFKKLLRTIWKTKGQFLAMVAIVTIGISVYIAVATGFQNLTRSRDLFYQRNDFADYYFQVVKAPEDITKQIEKLPEINKASGRIQQDITIIKNDKSRATGRLTSYSLPLDGELNRIELLKGRFFEKNTSPNRIEAMIDPQYLAANSLALGDKITAAAEDRLITLTITGTATGPEFTYIIKDAATLFPQPYNFAILMLPTCQAQKILNLDGQINQVLVKFNPGADEKKAVQKIEKILAPYGILSSFPRSQQLSHAVLQGELDGLLTTSRFLPFLFLITAAAIQFILLNRMIKGQHKEIGILKALGYSNRSLMLHFSSYTLAVSIMGAILGIILGLVFASAISDLYAQFFNLPYAIGGINLQVIIYSTLLSLLIGIIAGFSAAFSVTKINPAASMRPQLPAVSRHSLVEKWPWLWEKLGASLKMTLRTINRNRMRFFITSLGTALAVSLLIISFFINDSIDYMFDQHFNREIKYDLLIKFASPVSISEINSLANIDGITKIEPFLEVPVKIKAKNRIENAVLSGLLEKSSLENPVDKKGSKIAIPETGIIIGEKTARKLNLDIGETVTVEPLLPSCKNRETRLKVLGINHQLIGGNSFVSISQANQIIGEAFLINGAMLRIDKSKTAYITEKLGDITGITSIISRQNEKDNIIKMLDSTIYFVGIMAVFAVILGFAIIYNTSIMSFTERRLELASLQAMGFLNHEISSLIFKETFLQAVPGIIFGLPLGRAMAHAYIKTVSTDLYSMPVIIYPSTYFLAAVGSIIFIIIGHYLGIRRLKNLAPAEILKTVD